MPLLDHFRPPVHPRGGWETLQSLWAGVLTRSLNQGLLPPGYYAVMTTHFGPRVEADIAALEDLRSRNGLPRDGSAGGTVAAPVWTAPPPVMTIPAIFPDTFEVRVIATEPDAGRLAAAIELVSPANKDRPEERRTFAIKCASYLRQAVSLLMIDIVTTRKGNLHNEMVDLLLADPSLHLPAAPPHYAVAYQAPLPGEEVEKPNPQIAVWAAQFNVGDRLPVLPLGLSDELCIPIDLEATYAEACSGLRLI